MRGKVKDYEIIEKIASGGMADVFKAKKLGARGFSKIFAIKVIKEDISKDPKLKDMFVKEAELSARLVHPNIVQIFELGEVDGVLYIVMEYIHGKNLREIDKLIGFRKIPWKKSAYIAYKSALGLDFAHGAKDHYGRPLEIVHRDISPQNIMVTFSGEVKVADFGIAKVAKDGIKEEKVLAGKYPFMSPEQTKGDALDKRSDLFSLGIVFYQMLTGRPPFTGKNGLEIIKSIRNDAPTPPYKVNPDIPVNVSNIVMKCLEKEPDFRYNTGLEVAKDIEKYLPNLIDISNKLGEFLLEKYTVNLSNNMTKTSLDQSMESTETQISKTISSIMEMLREEPENVEYLEKIGSIYLIQKKFDKASEYFTRGLALDDSNFLIRFRLAQIFLRKKDKYSFSHQYTILKKLDPKNPHIDLLHLQYLIIFKKWKEAAKELKRLAKIEDFQDNIDFLVLQAEYYSFKKEYSKVINNYLKISEIEPEFYFFKEEVRLLVEDLYVSIFGEEKIIGEMTSNGEKKAEEARAKTYEGKKALVIEDDKNTRILLKIILSDEGFSVDMAKSAFNVEKLLEMHDYDLIIMDVLMPGKNGFKLLEQLQKSNLIVEHTKVFMISGIYKSAKFKNMASDLGVLVYLEKPFTAKQISRHIHKHVHGKVS